MAKVSGIAKIFSLVGKIQISLKKGKMRALSAGSKIKATQIKFDIAYTSALIRAQHTLSIILKEIEQDGLNYDQE